MIQNQFKEIQNTINNHEMKINVLYESLVETNDEH